MKRHFKDTGIVIKKIKLLEGHRLITIFSKNSGKLVLSGYGTRKITSRRLSHLETGSYISFSYYKKGEYLSLAETELISGFSGIRADANKLNIVFLAFFVLNKILPERVTEAEIFSKTLRLLCDINNGTETSLDSLKSYLVGVLLSAGFISEAQVNTTTFDSFAFVEDLINQKIKTLSL